MSKKKKVIVSMVMVLLLAATACLNVILTRTGDGTSTPGGTSGDPLVSTGNFFSEYRTERTSTREQEMLYLDSIIANTQLSQETVETAVKQKMEIVDMMEQELVLEGLIKSKGFEDVAVTMATENDNVNVVVKSDNLEQSDVAQIYNVLAEEVGSKHTNVKIIPVQ